MHFENTTGFVVWTIWKCVLTRSWNVTEIQLVHQQLAKCYYLKSGRKGAHSPKAAVFIFILSKSCDCKVTPNSTGYFLSSLNLHIMKSTLFKFHPLHNSSHFHLFPFFSTKWTWKQEVPLCFPDVSQQGKKDHPGEVSQVYCDGARVITWISAVHDYASFTWAVYPLLLTYKHPVSTLPSFDQWTVQTLSHAL